MISHSAIGSQGFLNRGPSDGNPSHLRHLGTKKFHSLLERLLPTSIVETVELARGWRRRAGNVDTHKAAALLGGLADPLDGLGVVLRRAIPKAHRSPQRAPRLTRGRKPIDVGFEKHGASFYWFV